MAHSCDICDVQFSFKSGLERHLQSSSHQLFVNIISDSFQSESDHDVATNTCCRSRR